MTFLAIRSLLQKDNYSFSIVWNNGREHLFHLSDLQKDCPCASCGQKKELVQSEVGANAIRSVGRYALSIQFTAGCSKGIYYFDWLYLKGEKG